jgi:predicted TIM-barrel fold metal-dependent hydrolase
MPHPAVIDAYFKDYPTMIGAGLGFTVETAAHAIRLSICGLFDTYPKLRIILGHMGEGLSFLLWRCDMALARDKGLKRKFQEYFREHFYITTSGNFSYPALACVAAETSTDRILFAVDWPYASNREGHDFIDHAPRCRRTTRKRSSSTTRPGCCAFKGNRRAFKVRSRSSPARCRRDTVAPS